MILRPHHHQLKSNSGHELNPNAGHELLVGTLDEQARAADARQRRLKRLRASEVGRKAKAVVCTP